MGRQVKAVYNIDNVYRMSMTLIQRVIFIHSVFKENCGRDKTNVS